MCCDQDWRYRGLYPMHQVRCALRPTCARGRHELLHASRTESVVSQDKFTSGGSRATRLHWRRLTHRVPGASCPVSLALEVHVHVSGLVSVTLSVLRCLNAFLMCWRWRQKLTVPYTMVLVFNWAEPDWVNVNCFDEIFQLRSACRKKPEKIKQI